MSRSPLRRWRQGKGELTINNQSRYKYPRSYLFIIYLEISIPRSIGFLLHAISVTVPPLVYATPSSYRLPELIYI